MKISKTHQKFSKELKEPRALTNPEDYLGPNWEDVINFWMYFDTLSKDEIDKMEDRYWDLDEDVRVYAWLAAYHAAIEVVGEEVQSDAWFAASVVTDGGSVFTCATEELLAHHKLLEQNKTLVAIPLCLKP
jgi:hypothetical protein